MPSKTLSPHMHEQPHAHTHPQTRSFSCSHFLLLLLRIFSSVPSRHQRSEGARRGTEIFFLTGGFEGARRGAKGSEDIFSGIFSFFSLDVFGTCGFFHVVSRNVRKFWTKSQQPSNQNGKSECPHQNVPVFLAECTHDWNLGVV